MNLSQPSPPVLVLAFNRPDTTEKVIAAIRQARPDRVFFAVDGARPDRPGEREQVLAVQKLADLIDWPCEITTLFRERNLGCKIAVSEAITWFFDEVESGIVLEDDCIAHPSFFRFAGELLERFKDDERIALVSGNNFQFGRQRTNYSYYYSRYNHIWGWASWSRAWKLYDHKMTCWPEVRAGDWLMDLFGDPVAVRYWTKIFDTTYAELNTSWAYRWTFACWIHSCLSVLPSRNLVSNVGFGAGATHTKRRYSVANLPAEPMEFPLSHPPYMIRDSIADSRTEKLMFSRSKRFLRFAKEMMQSLGLRWP